MNDLEERHTQKLVLAQAGNVRLLAIKRRAARIGGFVFQDNGKWCLFREGVIRHATPEDVTDECVTLDELDALIDDLTRPIFNFPPCGGQGQAPASQGHNPKETHDANSVGHL